MRQILGHTPAALRDAMLDLALGELADRTAAQVAEADRLAMLLGRGGSVYSRLDLHDELLRHQVVHPFRPVAAALRWELGDRAASALRCW
jgi:hypothetical protein